MRLPRTSLLTQPYERGLSLRTVLRGVLKRFLPGSFVSMTAVVTLVDPSIWSLGVQLALGLVGTASAITLGFGFLLASMGAGFRSPEAMALLPVLGFVMALLMFFPWLTGTPEELRLRVRALDAAAPRQLSEGRGTDSP